MAQRFFIFVFMPTPSTRPLFALTLSLALHAGLLAWSLRPPLPAESAPDVVAFKALLVPQTDAPPTPPQPTHQPIKSAPLKRARPAPAPLETTRAPETPYAPATQNAPPAPTAEEWQLASTYTPRNSKRYRHALGQQIRNLMGPAVEGPGQGMVRLRIEIAPDGKLARVEELWSTSEQVSARAREAIRTLPPLPPTPTGKPLVFERTIAFLPYETGWPPSYQLDCLPEPEPFANPFAWNGGTPPAAVQRAHRPPPPEGCPPDSTEDTIEAEEDSFKRQMDQWRWAR